MSRPEQFDVLILGSGKGGKLLLGTWRNRGGRSSTDYPMPATLSPNAIAVTERASPQRLLWASTPSPHMATLARG
jgi:hypothetical protein